MLKKFKGNNVFGYEKEEVKGIFLKERKRKKIFSFVEEDSIWIRDEEIKTNRKLLQGVSIRDLSEAEIEELLQA